MFFYERNVVFSQCGGRYQTEIFSSCSNVEIEYTDIHDWDSKTTGLKMDVYTPDGDTFTQRPLIIFAHGGVFMGEIKIIL